MAKAFHKVFRTEFHVPRRSYLTQLFSAGWLKQPSTCSVESSDKIFTLLEASYFRRRFHTLREPFSGLLQKKWQGCQTNVLRLRWNMLMKKWFTWKSFEVFINFGLWAKNTRQVCQTCILGVQSNILKINLLFWSETF